MKQKILVGCDHEEQLRADAHSSVYATENQVCQHHKFGYCKFRQQCLQEHVKTEYEDISACTGIKSCSKRHPKICRKYSLENFCRFGKDCSYVHISREHSEVCKDLEDEDMKNIKAKVDLLKNTVKSLSKIKKGGKLINKTIKALTERY